VKRKNILLILGLLVMVLGLASCERERNEGFNDFVEITLANQSNKTVNLLFPNENISQASKLTAGQTRVKKIRLEHISSVEFRAADNGQIIATKICQYREHQTSFRVSVIFDGSKLSCGQGW